MNTSQGRVLVTGGAGFLGITLIRSLQARDGRNFPVLGRGHNRCQLLDVEDRIAPTTFEKNVSRLPLSQRTTTTRSLSQSM